MDTDGPVAFVFGQSVTGDDTLSDPRLKGKVTYKYTVVPGQMLWWGTARLVPTIGGGEWNGYWSGTLGPGSTIGLALQGEGDYAGLVARLIYTPGTTYPYEVKEGYIVEAKGGPGDRPFKVSASETSEIEIFNCVPAPVVKATILRAVMEATHTGRSSNAGFSLLDPLTGEFTGTGTATAANGDKLYWVGLFTVDPMTGVGQGAVHFCGGTGQFDPAVGGFTFETQYTVADPTNPLISTACYNGSGTIRY